MKYSCDRRTALSTGCDALVAVAMRVFSASPAVSISAAGGPSAPQQFSWEICCLGQESLRFWLVLGPLLVRITECDLRLFLFTKNQYLHYRINVIEMMITFKNEIDKHAKVYLDLNEIDSTRIDWQKPYLNM